MTDKEIIKALECCSSPKANCEDCPCFNKYCISTTPYVLDLINRQQAYIEQLEKDKDGLAVALANAVGRNVGFKEDIERLKGLLDGWKTEAYKLSDSVDNVIAEAIKEFAERLKNLNRFSNQPDRYYIDNLVKEMVGEQE